MNRSANFSPQGDKIAEVTSEPDGEGDKTKVNKSLPLATLSRTIIYLGFAGTGVGMALPGSVLPILLTRWSLADSQAGLLFFLGWMGCSLGALLVRAPLASSLTCGSLLVAVAGFGMAFGTDTIHWSCFGWMAIYGLGLGMTMTAVSLLQASRNAQHRGAELNRLNLIWSIGACVCPYLASHSLRVASVRVIFSAVAVFFALLCLWTVVFESNVAAIISRLTPLAKRPGKWTLALWPLSLVIVVFLPTGIESSMGGWIAAYVQRTQQTIATTVTAGSCFWIGLMLSRTLSSYVLLRQRGRLSEQFVLRQSLVTVVLGALLLIASHGSLGILPGVFLVGFGLGPVYPLLLAIALQYSDNTAIFFVAGLGSAFLPWLTGIVSSSASSLREGLLVPLVASVLMLFLGFRLTQFKPEIRLGRLQN